MTYNCSHVLDQLHGTQTRANDHQSGGRTTPMMRPHDRCDVEFRFQYHLILENDTPILADQTSGQAPS